MSISDNDKTLRSLSDLSKLRAPTPQQRAEADAPPASQNAAQLLNKVSDVHTAIMGLKTLLIDNETKSVRRVDAAFGKLNDFLFELRSKLSGLDALKDSVEAVYDALTHPGGPAAVAPRAPKEEPRPPTREEQVATLAKNMGTSVEELVRLGEFLRGPVSPTPASPLPQLSITQPLSYSTAPGSLSNQTVQLPPVMVKERSYQKYGQILKKIIMQKKRSFSAQELYEDLLEAGITNPPPTLDGIRQELYRLKAAKKIVAVARNVFKVVTPS